MEEAGPASVRNVASAFVLDEFDERVVDTQLGAAGGAVQYSKAEETGVIRERSVEVADLEADGADMRAFGKSVIWGGTANGREPGAGSR